MLVLQLLFSGVQTGLIYALTAAGFALIFGATRIFHVAHGATFAIAGYAFVAVQPGYGWAAGCLVALLLAVLFGVGMERLVYRPIARHEASFFTVFVAAFGASVVVQSLIEVGFGRSFTSISTPLTRAVAVVPGLYVAPVLGIAAVVAVVMLGLVAGLLARTRVGLGLRALASNPELLRVFGLSSRRLSMLAFAVGSALAVPGAVLTAMTSGLTPSISAHVMLISLAATVVGGIGSLPGAVVAGLLLGVTENLAVAVLDTQWSEAAGFVLLFVFIVFKPRGLFGSALAVGGTR